MGIVNSIKKNVMENKLSPEQKYQIIKEHIMKYKFIFLILCICNLSFAENNYYLDTIIVTATKKPVESHSITRNVIVITKEDIQENGFKNIEEILNFLGLVDVQSRYQNIQSDISIRGTTFEQSLILINGIVINNPQSGHHNLNLPITLNNIERIEIMPGHSSSLYGSYGFGGTINFITKDFHPQNVNLSISYGTFNTLESSVALSYSFKRFDISINVSKEKSDGFRDDTDYDIFKANISTIYSFKKDENLKLLYGFISKDFGAYDFYTPGKNLPSTEKIENNIFFVSLTKRLNRFYIQPQLYYNKSYDNFILTKDNPDFYHNIHYVDKYGADFILGFNLIENLNITAVINKNTEKIDSSNLGKHSRKNFSIGTEILYNLERFGINVSLRNDFYSNNEKLYSPGIGFYYWITYKLKLRGAGGISYRMPSFTELYYKDAYNIGNQNLNSEKNNSYEMGIDFFEKMFVLKNTLFYRNEYNVIDWVERDSIWYAENISQIKFYGVESELILFLLKNVKFTFRNLYIYANSTKNYVSKYGLNYTSNQSSFLIHFPFVFNIGTSICTVYKIRKESDYAITSLYFSRETLKNVKLFFKAKNIFNEQYEEIKGIPQPGREIKFGMEIKL